MKLSVLGAAVVAAAVATVGPAAAQAGEVGARRSLALTVYNGDLGLVKEVRQVDLRAGRQRVSFLDFPARIDPTSVLLEAPEGVALLSQTYSTPPAADALLSRHVGREVLLVQPPRDGAPERTIRATLVSTAGGNVFRIGDTLHVNPPGYVALPDAPAATSPARALTWELDARRAGSRPIAVNYLTQGLSWQADYVLTDAVGEAARLAAWVSLVNESGARYPDARLTLVAGELNRTESAPKAAFDAMAQRAGAAPVARALADYRAYDMAGRFTLEEGQTTQLPLFDAGRVSVAKRYRYEGGSPEARVMASLHLANTEKGGLGRPLPAGRVRLYQLDAGTPRLIGEDRIGHTPVGETVALTAGAAFDVVGERRQLSFRQLRPGLQSQTIEVVLRNRKPAPVTVDVVERLWGDWRVTEKTHPFVKERAGELRFPVPVPARGAARLRYTAVIRG